MATVEHLFAYSGVVVETRFRWRLADDDDDGGQPTLFPDEAVGERHVGTGEFRGLEFLHVNAQRVINPVPATSRMAFRYTINAYRGCSHACVYCFARPTHQYLGLGIGEDFERRLVVKVNAVERVRAELRHPRWAADTIAMGTNTDPYQRCEGKYHLTQGIVAALGERANPFSILTKSTLILRDLDLLAEAARRTTVRCNLSIGTLDPEVWKLTEPGTPHPARRLEAVRKLNAAGVPTGVLVAPIIPGLSDGEEQLRAVVDACLDAGAVAVVPVVLHLRRGVRDHVLQWARRTRPDLAERWERQYRRAYLPAAAARAITDTVHAAVDDHGGRTRHPRRASRSSGRAPAPPTPPRSATTATTATTATAATAATAAGPSRHAEATRDSRHASAGRQRVEHPPSGQQLALEWDRPAPALDPAGSGASGPDRRRRLPT